MSARPVLLTRPSDLLELSPPSVMSQWAMTSCILAADFFTLFFVFGVTALARHLATPAIDLSANLEMLPCLILLLAAFAVIGLYPGVLLHQAEEMRRIFVCISTVFLFMAAGTFLWRNAESYSRSIFLITWAAAAPILLLSRYLTRRRLGNKRWWGLPAIVFGSGPTAERVVRKMQNGFLGLKVVGVVSDEKNSSWPGDLPPILGGFSATRSPAEMRAAHYAILALPNRSNTELRQIIQDHCQGFNHVLLVPDMPGVCSLGISAREIGGELAFELPQRLFRQNAAVAKRVLDVLLAGLALLLVSPLFLLIAILIKLSSPGPVFFRHSRHGRRAETFRALKFRTMLPNAERILNNYLAKHPEFLFEWQRDRKLKNDPRVTTIGKWLRRFSLDELPQLLNVLAGHMSLVGPRPLPLADLEKYGSGYELYSRVRPGVTGLWQVSGRNNTTYEERIAFDEYYVRNWSIWLDAYILVWTVKAVITAEGAY